MSLILEALRKSEAERRLGQAPDLLTPLPSAARARRRRPLRALVLMMTLAAVGAGAWWLGQRQAATSAVTPGDTPRPAPVASSPAPVATTPPIAALAPATATAAATPSAPPATTTSTGEAPPPTATRAPDPTPPGPASPADLAALRARLEAATVAAAAPQPADTPTSVAHANLPTPDELPADRRAGLPPLRLSMHVYTEDPARRFVIIDGQRRTEGAALGGGVRLLGIDRDGAVLDIGDHLIRLRRP